MFASPRQICCPEEAMDIYAELIVMTRNAQSGQICPLPHHHQQLTPFISDESLWSVMSSEVDTELDAGV